MEQANQADSILEIGTGSGLGSTRCLAEGMSNISKLVTVEADYEQFKIGRHNVSVIDRDVFPLYGILHRGILPYSHPQDSPQIRECWEHEKNLVDIGPVLDVETIGDDIDLLFLDGGEYTSCADFLLLWHKARTVVLDDCNPEKAVKNVAAMHFMYQNPAFELIRMELPDRNGWCAFRRK